MATKKRCLASLSLSGSWGTEYLWPDLEVDLDRELAPGFTVGDAVRGREDCFADLEPVAHTPALATATPTVIYLPADPASDEESR